jgi:hypothetical protein
MENQGVLGFLDEAPTKIPFYQTRIVFSAAP